MRPGRTRRLPLMLAGAAIATLLAWPLASWAVEVPDSERMHWVAGDLPPYAWSDSAGPSGLAYELVRVMGERMGRKVTVDFYPWARAVRIAQQGGSVGLFPLARTPERESDYRWLLPLGKVRQAFFGGPETDVEHIESLRAQRIGVLRGSFTGRALADKGFQSVVAAVDYEELLRMLDRHVIDAIYASDEMFNFTLRKRGGRAAAVRQGLSLGAVEIYMATATTCNEAEAQRWLQAYRDVVADGTLARLERKYLSGAAAERR